MSYTDTFGMCVYHIEYALRYDLPRMRAILDDSTDSRPSVKSKRIGILKESERIQEEGVGRIYCGGWNSEASRNAIKKEVKKRLNIWCKPYGMLCDVEYVNNEVTKDVRMRVVATLFEK